MSKKIIVSWSSEGREHYPLAQLNLIKSCVNANWDGDYLMQSYDGYCDEYLGVKIQLGKYPQSEKYPLNNNQFEIPYAFKPTLIQQARELGYEQILYMDSTMRLIGDTEKYFELAKQNGIVAFENLGHPFRNYISDVALKQLDIPFESLDNVKQIMACCLLFDFSNYDCERIFEKWIQMAHDGLSFHNGYESERPEFISHRHDQVCLSGLLYKNNIPVLPYGGLAYHPHEETKEYGEITFLNYGVN